jgi:hypothetical protein
MPGTSEFAEVSYTLSDLVVAAYDITANTYGTPISAAIGQSLEVDAEHDTDKLQGYGVTMRLLSVPRGAKIKLGMGGVDFDFLAAVAGISNYLSNLSPNQQGRSRFPAGGSGLPYFGAIGVSATDDGGLAAIGLQACKLDKYPTWTADGKTNKFNMSEVNGYAVPVAIGGSLYLHTVRRYQQASLWTPPTTGAEFLAFFTA